MARSPARDTISRMTLLRAFASLALSVCGSIAISAGCGGQVDAPFPNVPNPDGRPLAAACAFDEQCASNRCSADSVAGTCGECVTIEALGHACTGPHQGCSASAVCKNGFCQSLRKVEGEGCKLGPKGGDLMECDVELYCARVGDTWDHGQCVHYTPLGESCADENSRCPPGAVCDENKVCAIPVPGSCGTFSTYCARESYCGDDNMCHPGTLAEGEKCGLVDGEFLQQGCAPGLICWHKEGDGTGTTCVPLPKKGEPCILTHCAEGLFCLVSMENDTITECDTPRGEGEACSNQYYFTIACADGLECRGDVCRPACQ